MAMVASGRISFGGPNNPAASPAGTNSSLNLEIRQPATNRLAANNPSLNIVDTGGLDPDMAKHPGGANAVQIPWNFYRGSFTVFITLVDNRMNADSYYSRGWGHGGPRNAVYAVWVSGRGAGFGSTLYLPMQIPAGCNEVRISGNADNFLTTRYATGPNIITPTGPNGEVQYTDAQALTYTGCLSNNNWGAGDQSCTVAVTPGDYMVLQTVYGDSGGDYFVHNFVTCTTPGYTGKNPIMHTRNLNGGQFQYTFP